MQQSVILDAINEAKVLGIFKKVCDMNSTPKDKMRLINIYAQSTNNIKTTSNFINMNLKINLNQDEALRIYQLIASFLHKSKYRKPIDFNLKKNLLSNQNNKCAICNKEISIKSHVDHIIPFKYVGDELANNLQILCEKCNKKKHDSLDYQIKHLLNLV